MIEVWTQVSEYVEQFIAGQDTFLHERRHDQLLFDDDSFTRSRQYSWVITSTGEFILIIGKTLDHYESLTTQLFSRLEYTDILRDQRKLLAKIQALKEVFERQRTRATDLREGVSVADFHSYAIITKG